MTNAGPRPLRLDPDRLFPADPATRGVASALYREIATLTVVSARQPVDELVADIIGRLPEEIRAESRADSGPGSGSG